jgi:hypothetical protein
MWHLLVQRAIDNALTVATGVIGVFARVNCALQRSDAFPAIGTLQKPAWLAIIGISTFIALCLGWQAMVSGQESFGMLFKLIALGAAALYLLDVRPGLRDISNGRGPW